jgi:hypothetical protein
MQVQKAKFPLKNLLRQLCAEGANSGVKELITGAICNNQYNDKRLS